MLLLSFLKHRVATTVPHKSLIMNYLQKVGVPGLYRLNAFRPFRVLGSLHVVAGKSDRNHRPAIAYASLGHFRTKRWVKRAAWVSAVMTTLVPRSASIALTPSQSVASKNPNNSISVAGKRFLDSLRSLGMTGSASDGHVLCGSIRC